MQTRLIGEIGINTLGDIDLTKKLIETAKFCGCWAVKFQKRNPDLCVPSNQRDIIKDTPWGKIKYIDYKKKIEFSLDQYKEIDQFCKEKNIEWSASVWDLDSLNFMRDNFNHVKFLKIPSAKLTDTELVHATAGVCAENQIILIISRGMSTGDEIDQAVGAINSTNIEKSNIVLMHCNSSYPAPNKELNLRCISTLKKRFPDFQIGYSDHAFGIIPSLTAVVLGATYIEKHITLDRTMWGSDQMCSCEPTGLIKLGKDIKEVEESLGDGVIRVYPSELEKMKSLRG